jgi:hypothetical protein
MTGKRWEDFATELNPFQPWKKMIVSSLQPFLYSPLIPLHLPFNKLNAW